MRKIFMSYNPFTLKCRIKSEKEYINFKVFEENQGSRLQFWVNGLTEKLYYDKDIGNGGDFNLVFHGHMFDYLDIKEDVDKFNSLKKGKVTLEYKETKSAENKLQDLKKLFNYMQETTPIADLKKEKVINEFNKAMSSEFEVAVISTMSSGKSTFINALLGAELLPSKSQACTASIIRIKDNKEINGFKASFIDKNNRIIEEVENIEYEQMDEFNKNENVHFINIEGNIPFTKSNNINLVLIDTPGTSNAKNTLHKEMTYSLIKYSNPMILYIIDYRKFNDESDEILFKEVMETIKGVGKQSSDRFIFVLNMVDEYEHGKDDSLEDIKNALLNRFEKNGIKNPNIFFVSSKLAKLIRLNKQKKILEKLKNKFIKNDDLLIIQVIDFFEKKFKYFLNFEVFYLEKYSTLSTSGKNIIEKALKNVKNDEDKVLIHTGIPSIEIAINEYLEKYAVTQKVYDAVLSFKNNIEFEKIKNNFAEKINDDEEKRKMFNERIEEIKKTVEDGRKVKEFDAKIDELNIKESIKDLTVKLRTKVSDEITTIWSNIRETYINAKSEEGDFFVKVEDAEKYVDNFYSAIKELEPVIKVDIENIINNSIKIEAENIVKEYREYIKNIFNNLGDEVELNISDDLNIVDIFSDSMHPADKIASNFSTKIKVGVREENKFTNNLYDWWDFLAFWRLFQKEYIPIYEDRVPLEKCSQELMSKVNVDFEKKLNEIINIADEKISVELKEYFKSEMHSLDRLLEERIKEMGKISRDEESLKAFIEENKNKKEWINDFQERLDKILEI